MPKKTPAPTTTPAPVTTKFEKHEVQSPYVTIAQLELLALVARANHATALAFNDLTANITTINNGEIGISFRHNAWVKPRLDK